MFGTVLSLIINFFLTSRGQISVVGTIVSAGYGFICGAYMPISSFGKGKHVLTFFPGTYGTSLMREHTMRGAFEALFDAGVPKKLVDEFKDSVDCNMYFYDDLVSTGNKFTILAVSAVALTVIYMLINVAAGRRKRK